ncbi:double zinc ribbon domain-containing protein [Bacillus wiedmannii]
MAGVNKQCSECNHANPSDANYCEMCGKKLD